MIRSTRVIPVLATAAICVASIGAPAVAEGSMTSWSKSQCSSWKNGYLKRHKHPSKSEKAKANKVLKAHGCSVRIK